MGKVCAFAFARCYQHWIIERITRAIIITLTIPTVRYRRGLRLALIFSGISLKVSIDGTSSGGSSAYSDHCWKSFLVFLFELKVSLTALTIGCAIRSRKTLLTFWPESFFLLTFNSLPQCGQQLVLPSSSRPQ